MKSALLSSVFAGALIGLPAASQAAGVEGRVTASAYAFESSPTDSTTVTHLRSHTALRLTARDLGPRGLTVHTYVRASTDLSESADDDPRLRVYNLYVRYRDRGLDVRAGRQRVFAGVGYGTVDGARVDLEHAGVSLALFGGALAPVRSEGLDPPSEAHLVGLRLSSRRFAGTDLSVSLADREREPLAYAEAGRYSGFVGRPQAVHRRLLGLQAGRRFGLHSLRGRLDYDLLDEGLRRLELAGRLGLSQDLALSVEWRHREPDLYEGSVLAVFSSQPYDEIGLRLHYRASSAVSLSARGATVLYDGDDSQRLGLSVTLGRYLTFGYRRWQGYAGDQDGLAGQLLVPLRRDLVLRAQLDLSSFDRFEAEDRDGLATALAGLTWRPDRSFSLDGQLQGLRNPSYDTDLRLLVRGSWRFRR